MTLADFAAKERARKRAEQRMNSTSQGAANGQGSVGDLKCTGLEEERRPCTEMMVRDLARRMGEKSAEHPALAEINSLRLESSDGTLSCSQRDGNPCSAEQVRSLNEHVAAEMSCDVRLENPSSDAANATDTHPTPSSDTAAKVAAWESSLNTPATTSDLAAKERERAERKMAITSDLAAKEQEREKAERKMAATSDLAAKERERERAERKMATTSDLAAKERERERAEQKMNSPSQVAAKGQASVAPKTQRTHPATAPPRSAKKPNAK
jgi:hypothetical protein